MNEPTNVSTQFLYQRTFENKRIQNKRDISRIINTTSIENQLTNKKTLKQFRLLK